MFDDGFELNPKAAALGLGGGVISVFVMSGVETGIFIKIISFALTSVVCYFMVDFIANR